ncbi:hypothetical protein [Cryobacterium breve]|uniref:hypothetical protein n=1 Tax=Cryobacterium breve TaxID=1259258 RepID=UPI001F5476CE|nr:hypothetical protein [Cryobacterium breve]
MRVTGDRLRGLMLTVVEPVEPVEQVEQVVIQVEMQALRELRPGVRPRAARFEWGRSRKVP